MLVELVARPHCIFIWQLSTFKLTEDSIQYTVSEKICSIWYENEKVAVLSDFLIFRLELIYNGDLLHFSSHFYYF